ncbi:aromatic ring-hydroxylating oxygenase subunit alpha [Derxia gummosa]|uniref:Aromatic ring-hydroxylating oxygenase subunit alpha n=1 Tax=Derxia gummosa DSM 723 TaxID=1121388 RepID=A0A8B6X3E1_9BURK|nr:aromatic ring-hydroxylating dioxygenase subunit alpha [Derxia gummosa]
MFPKNAWYVAALPDEIPADKPLGRTICDERIAFFRDADGRVAAVEDFCPHRGAPMSLGKVCGGRLQCGYHGLEMDRDGKTVAMPAQRVRGFPAVRRYAVEERHGFIWLWPGDAALATPDTIPDLAWARQSDWAFGGGVFHVKCDYRLMIDNLMDLTHETYVHSTSIGQKEIDEAPPVTRVDGDRVVTEREMHGVMPPPFWQAGLRANGLPDDQPVDRWQKCRFVAPSNVLIDVGVALAGKGGFDAPAELKANGIVVDFITPETATTHWYFWGLARHFKADDAALTAATRERQGQIFSEDMEMLERQQLNLSAHPQRALLKLNIDAGGVQARKIIERLCAEEAAGVATKEVA